MGKAFKKIAFYLITIALTAAIYWLVFVDNASKQDVLEYSLSLLGKKLMAMMPDTSNTQPVASLYDDFVARAKNKQIPPETIESMAATILNLSNLDTRITPQEAEAIIRFSLQEPVMLDRVKPDSLAPAKPVEVPGAIVILPPRHPREPALTPEPWRTIAERIRSAQEFNDAYRKAMKDYRQAGAVPPFQFHFDIDEGLRIAMDSTMKHQLDRGKFRQLQRQLHELEKQRIIIWQKDYHQKIMQEMQRQRRELDSLRQLNQWNQVERIKALEHLKQLESLRGLNQLNTLATLKQLEALKSLEALKKLDSLQVPAMGIDSIRWFKYKFIVDSLLDSTEQH